MPDANRDDESLKSEYGLGPLAFAGGSNISAEAAISGAAYNPEFPEVAEVDRAIPGRDVAGSRFRVAPGVPGTEEAELADRILSIKSPPLPELTVI